MHRVAGELGIRTCIGAVPTYIGAMAGGAAPSRPQIITVANGMRVVARRYGPVPAARRTPRQSRLLAVRRPRSQVAVETLCALGNARGPLTTFDGSARSRGPGARDVGKSPIEIRFSRRSSPRGRRHQRDSGQLLAQHLIQNVFQANGAIALRPGGAGLGGPSLPVAATMRDLARWQLELLGTRARGPDRPGECLRPRDA